MENESRSRLKRFFGRLNEIPCLVSLLDQIKTSFDLIRSMSIRIIFSIHSLIAICLVCWVENDLWYFVNSVGIVFMGIEYVVVALPRGGKDLFWFSPSFFLYILTIIPPTWFLELDNIRIKTLKLERLQNVTRDTSMDLEQLAHLDLNQTDEVLYEMTAHDFKAVPVLASDIKLLLHDSTQNFAMYIEVTMMLIIIVSRWAMPKEGITRSELSQLLLVYMSLTSDIIDLLSVLQEQTVIQSRPMVYTTLSIYSWSLFQFTLNLVVNRGRTMSTRRRGGVTGSALAQPPQDLRQSLLNGSNVRRKKSLFENELLNVVITLVMQDGPFFVLRLLCIFQFNIASYLFLFFTFKNGILFFLQIYRITTLCTEWYKHNKLTKMRLNSVRV